MGRPSPITDPQHRPDLTLALNKSLPGVKPNPALFHSTVAAPLSSCSDYLHPSNNTAAREDPTAGRRCLSIQSPLLLERGRGGMTIQDSGQASSEVVVPGRERGLKLLLCAGNEYLNNCDYVKHVLHYSLPNKTVKGQREDHCG